LGDKYSDLRAYHIYEIFRDSMILDYAGIVLFKAVCKLLNFELQRVQVAMDFFGFWRWYVLYRTVLL
jgi:hypothetical protein